MEAELRALDQAILFETTFEITGSLLGHALIAGNAEAQKLIVAAMAKADEARTKAIVEATRAYIAGPRFNLAREDHRFNYIRVVGNRPSTGCPGMFEADQEFGRTVEGPERAREMLEAAWESCILRAVVGAAGPTPSGEEPTAPAAQTRRL